MHVYTQVHTKIVQCLAACQASTCSSQDLRSPHQLHSVHTVSIQCLSKTYNEPSPSIHSTKIEYSLVTQDMPTTEHVIQLITGHTGCRGLWWERQAQQGDKQGANAPTSPSFLTANRALKPALITKQPHWFLEVLSNKSYNSNKEKPEIFLTLRGESATNGHRRQTVVASYSEVHTGCNVPSCLNCGWPTSKLCPNTKRQGDSVSGSAKLISSLRCKALGSGFVCWHEATGLGAHGGRSSVCNARRRTVNWLICCCTQPCEPSLTSGKSYDPRQRITHVRKTWTSEYWSFKHAINGVTDANIFYIASGMSCLFYF